MDNSKINKLKELGELYKKGILTKEELENEKKKLLSDNKTTDSFRKENNSDYLSRSTDDKPHINTEIKIANRKASFQPKPLSPSKKRLIYILAAIVILIGIGVFIGLFQHHQSVIAQQKEQARLDSIAEVERLAEIKRQDSIAEVKRILEMQRQDSIAKAQTISPENLLKFKKNKYGDRYLAITDNLESYLKSIGYELTNKTTFYDQEGTDGTGPDLKYYKYEFKKNGNILTYYHEDGYSNVIPYIHFSLSSEKDAKDFINKCKKMGFEYSYSNNGYVSYSFPDMRGTVTQKDAEISIDFNP